MRILSVILVLCLFALPVQAEAGDKAKKFVENISSKVFDIVSDTNASKDTKAKELKTLFNKYVDTKWMGKFVLGRYYRRANSSQKKRYHDLYHDYLIGVYIPKFVNYDDESYEINSVTPANGGQHLVRTTIIRPGEANVRVDYRIKEVGNTFKVIDIISEGISVLSTQRSEFGAIVNREGMDGLLEKLANKQ